ncbi:MAG: carbonate dehydratase [Marinomonas sp.]|uniref:carbonate dehydratase n=1 Tax=unclassified Marinomonas TaxID=196814 RepID=UPI0005F9AB83|nr:MULTISPECIES: carbonate dehydratase [unclassified Marinomonas]KJZ14272.1 carbonate dehydratase [Marinomonas sp. S3726]KZM44159.1 carbonate dehydratase [Marinomonas sp. SBI22]KZM45318.1 carbonate dehydratase [Marinomonas sp. SBI8L]
MSKLDNLFSNNREWAESITREQPDFFETLSKQQKPEYLWIGCADSRVPANEIINLMPGEVFVHRNIANVVVHTDLNCLSVIQFAVEVLKVKHIMVVGHYGCGGIKAALDSEEHGLIDNWLRHIKDVHRFHQEKMDAETDEKRKFDLLCELNVMEQVNNVCQTSIVQKAWNNDQELHVHGWVYGINNGLIKDLDVTVSSN